MNAISKWDWNISCKLSKSSKQTLKPETFRSLTFISTKLLIIWGHFRFVRLSICPFVHQSIILSVCLFLHFFIHPSFPLFVYLFIHPSTFLCICLFVHIFIHPSFPPFVFLFVHPSTFVCICLLIHFPPGSIHLYAFLSKCLSICQSIHLSVYLFIPPFASESIRRWIER